MKDYKNTIKNSQKILGFTLIEIMVAVSIFSMVMLVAIGAVLSVVSANKKSQALNSVLGSLNFALEGMMRDLRTGYDYDCGATGSVSDCPTASSDSIGFISEQTNSSVEYGLHSSGASGRIYKQVNGLSLDITPPEINISKLDFYVVGTDHTDDIQPRIVIIIRGVYNGFGSLTDFNLQTMVSQRKVDYPAL